MSNKQKQATRLYKKVERLAVRANVDVDEQISWLIDHSGLELLFEAYFSPKTTCPTCASLARAVMLPIKGEEA